MSSLVLSRGFSQRVSPLTKTSQCLAMSSATTTIATQPGKSKKAAHHMTWHVPETLPRQVLDDGSILITRSPPSPTPASVDVKQLPPLLRPRKTHFKSTPISPLTPSSEQDLISLRKSDPNYWTVSRLCTHFKTYPFKVLSLVGCGRERRETLEREKEEEWAEMSVWRKKTLVDRMRRKEMW